MKRNTRLIASTPPSECSICDVIVPNIKSDGKGGGYISKNWLEKNGCFDHLAGKRIASPFGYGLIEVCDVCGEPLLESQELGKKASNDALCHRDCLYYPKKQGGEKWALLDKQ